MSITIQIPLCADPTSPTFQKGAAGNRTAIVLAAPGRLECDAGHPAAKQTGINIDRLLCILSEEVPDAFPSATRTDYLIVNSVEAVLFGRKSVPTRREIAQPGNLARLRRQLAGIETFVALGSSAKTALKLLSIVPTYHGIHPGYQALNSKFHGGSGDVASRVAASIEAYASAVLTSRVA